MFNHYERVTVSLRALSRLVEVAGTKVTFEFRSFEEAIRQFKEGTFDDGVIDEFDRNARELLKHLEDIKLYSSRLEHKEADQLSGIVHLCAQVHLFHLMDHSDFRGGDNAAALFRLERLVKEVNNGLLQQYRAGRKLKYLRPPRGTLFHRMIRSDVRVGWLEVYDGRLLEHLEVEKRDAYHKIMDSVAYIRRKQGKITPEEYSKIGWLLLDYLKIVEAEYKAEFREQIDAEIQEAHFSKALRDLEKIDNPKLQKVVGDILTLFRDLVARDSQEAGTQMARDGAELKAAVDEAAAPRPTEEHGDAEKVAREIELQIPALKEAVANLKRDRPEIHAYLQLGERQSGISVKKSLVECLEISVGNLREYSGDKPFSCLAFNMNDVLSTKVRLETYFPKLKQLFHPISKLDEIVRELRLHSYGTKIGNLKIFDPEPDDVIHRESAHGHMTKIPEISTKVRAYAAKGNLKGGFVIDIIAFSIQYATGWSGDSVVIFNFSDWAVPSRTSTVDPVELTTRQVLARHEEMMAQLKVVVSEMRELSRIDGFKGLFEGTYIDPWGSILNVEELSEDIDERLVNKFPTIIEDYREEDWASSLTPNQLVYASYLDALINNFPRLIQMLTALKLFEQITGVCFGAFIGVEVDQLTDRLQRSVRFVNDKYKEQIRKLHTDSEQFRNSLERLIEIIEVQVEGIGIRFHRIILLQKPNYKVRDIGGIHSPPTGPPMKNILSVLIPGIETESVIYFTSWGYDLEYPQTIRTRLHAEALDGFGFYLPSGIYIARSLQTYD